jgi:predicted RNA-binding protein YlxR (DUF448 family)
MREQRMRESSESLDTNPHTPSAPSASVSASSALKSGSASSAVPSGSAKPKAKRKGPARPKHVPQRTCIACKQTRPKRELIRIVRTPDGHVLLDETGKKSGRGAYLCAKRSCWEPAVRKGKLEHEFELTLLPEDRAALEAYIETLPAEPAPAPAAKPKRAPRTPNAPSRPSAGG